MSEEKVTSAPEGGKGKKWMVPAIAGGLVIAGAATFFFGQKVGAGTKRPEKEPPGYRMKLEEMVVNLRDRDQFIKATPEVEFKQSGARGEKAAGEFAPYISRIEGAITLVFRSTPVDKLSSGEGIKQVERQMIARINASIEEPEGQVKDVVLGKFATQ
jgi:flagellar basal body-associated protein FliL